jgi:hypothetical protein
MNTSPRERSVPAALHLLWAVPLGAMGALLVLGFASFVRCGFTECRSGGQGSVAELAFYALIAGSLAALPFWFVRWTTSSRVRLAVGLVLGAVTAVLGGAAVAHP